MADDPTTPANEHVSGTPSAGGDPPPADGVDSRLAGRSTDDLRDVGAAFEVGDRAQLVDAARHLRTDLRTDLFGPTSFFPVFLLALLTVFAVPLAAGRGLVRLLAFTTALLMVWTALSRARIRPRIRHVLHVAVVVAFIGAAAANLVSTADLHPTLLKLLAVFDSCVFGLILAVTTVLALRELLHHEAITVSSIGAAMAAYLMIGLFFATAYGGTAAAEDGRFFAQPVDATPSAVTYFSFITLTTVGYGDLSPGTPTARALVVAEAITGQIFLVTIVARVVSSFGTRREGVRSPPSEPTPAERRARRRAERRQSRDASDHEPIDDR